MLPKLTILMLLATIIPESLSGPTNASNAPSLLPEDPDRLKALEAALSELRISTPSFETMVENTPNILADSNRHFHSEFLKTLIAREKRDKPENFVFSAFSMHSALTAIYLASEEGSTTHKQLAKALGFESGRREEYLVNYYQLIRIYKEDETNIKVANGIFTSPGLKVHQEFKDLIFGFYGTKPEILEGGEGQINEFVEEETDGLIKELMAPGSVTDATDVVVLNTLLHKGKWKLGFNEKDTDDMLFTYHDGSTDIYPYGMTLTSTEVEYAEFDGYKVVALRYQDTDNYKMYALLTDQNDLDSLNRLTRSFKYQDVESNLVKHPDGVCILMPRLELSKYMELNKVMRHMGVIDPFELSKANLKVMTPKTTVIEKAITETFVKIDEEGSKGGAATAFTMCTRHIHQIGPKPLLFNKPFSIFIVDIIKGNYLFTARIVNPFGKGTPTEP